MSQPKPEILAKAQSWLTDVFDEETKKEINNLIENDPSELEDSFYKNAAFGTGGMRGVMGVGTNRINKYTLGKNTQGLSNFLKREFSGETLKVAIAYDCRNNSKELAQVVADVFSANDIEVFLFSDLRPTPELSFAVKDLDCHCGIVLTASHNPPEYNGYKVYWQDGGQLVPPQDKALVEEINGLEYEAINFDANTDLIHKIDKEVDEKFINASVKNGSFDTSAEAKANLGIVFTSLHGTSITMVPPVLEKAGFTNVTIVEEQREPDGNFPTVKSPNPEEPEALKMALDIAEEKGADIVIGTDPDCDRLGIAVRNSENKLELLNGNQTMVVMTWFLLEQWKKADKIDGNEFIASTIVSTPMLKNLSEAYGVEYKEVLTGFKWIAKLIKDHPELDFIGGGEESFGYMVGDFVRDKDAVTSTLLACEISAFLKAQGSSFYEKLLELYTTYGLYKEELISLVKKGIEGEQEIKQMLIDLREKPWETIDGEKVVLVEDYQSSIAKNQNDHTKTEITIPKSNVLIYYTEDGTKIAARPSGTEPKIKFYFSVNTSLDSVSDFEEKNKELKEKISRIKAELQLG
ncbi:MULTISPECIES: phospho-sugar mutase [Zunongwangia]|uniref:Phosphoglucomutase n=1 Tax=Zunongwangia profunda TaxID=398743 RepID=A0A3D5J1Z0_9FLAO|nr:phospho-sugar mutase [Zunongwangia profunda]MAG86419.1 phosphoglucomutase [Flavobacteriaceae bacterium]MAS69282.1 phosphoglucomutase [Zunongwangia sp.]HAJ82710.1 phosphoglucomutase [Zunongwangia profunda]HCV81964.1 phosphoglucomutase [Zunongwangia profunda]|tara:strand:+ start:3422 stop:5152 length:1731 start_codon:yes stop_codon:yes gene_type:complete